MNFSPLRPQFLLFLLSTLWFGTSLASPSPTGSDKPNHVDIITLAQATPSEGQPGVTSITLTGSQFPAGTIKPSEVQIALTPQKSNVGQRVSFSPTAITTLSGSSRRLTFTIPTTISVASPTSYLISVEGQTTDGACFKSGNSSSFTIDPAAEITAILPDSASPGQSLSVTIIGQFTTFTQGSTVANFGSGIAVGGGSPGAMGPVKVVSQTMAVAQIVVDPAATLGPRNVTIQTGVQIANFSNCFSIKGLAASILSVTPNTGYPGTVSGGALGSIFLTGHDPDFHAYAGPDASGAADLNKRAIAFITNPSYNAFAARGVHKFLFVSSRISPPSGHVDGVNGMIASGFVLGKDFDQADASQLTAALGELGTSYDALVIASDFGGILTQSELDVLTARSADIITFLNQGGGLYAMAETAPAEGGLATNNFFGFLPFVLSSTPLNETESNDTLTPFGSSLGLTAPDIKGNYSHCVFPSTEGLNVVDFDGGGEILSLAGRGSTSSVGVQSVTIVGKSTHFVQGTTHVNFGAGITVGTIAVVDSTHLTAQIAISSTATFGPRTVTVTTGEETASLVQGFTVLANPSITQIMPNAGQAGQQNISVTITGQNTHFVQGVTSATFGTGIAISSVTVNSSTNVTAKVNINANTAIGPRNVSLTTGNEVVSTPNGFAVTAPPPVLSLLNPNSGMQAQQNLPIAITGQSTHFVQGTSKANFGAGVTIVSLTINSPNSANAVVNIDLTAAIGSRDVTLTTGSEVATLAAGFAVIAALPKPPVFTSTPPSGPTWINLTANGPMPAGRDVAGSSPQVYDETNDRLIFFSGDRGNPGSIPADVWVLANASGASGTPTWIQLNPQPGPIGRESHSLTYLAKSNRLVVCGGGSHEGTSADLKDCWILTNANGLGGTPVWSQLPDMPTARGTHSAVYDPASNRLIVFGGAEPNTATVGDTIILENADGTGTPAWTTPNIVGTLPTGREQHAAFYDSANNRMVVVGGLYPDTYTTLNDVWALDNANAVGLDPHWTQLSPGGNAFPGLSAETIVYDQTRNQAQIFGGFSQNKPLATTSVSDLWLLTCANGIGCTPQWNLQSPIGGPPIPRALHAAGLSAAKGLMPITFGRYETATGGYANLSDTWVLNADAVASVAGSSFSYQATANDPRGENLTFSLGNAPIGMKVNPGTGLLNFTPSSTQLGNQAVSLKVQNTDGLKCNPVLQLGCGPRNWSTSDNNVGHS